jgi:hypothetical protein
VLDRGTDADGATDPGADEQPDAIALPVGLLDVPTAAPGGDRSGHGPDMHLRV